MGGRAKIEPTALIEAYNKGQSLNTIAKTFGTYPTSVRRILERNNIKLRHDSKKNGDIYVENGEKLIEWAKAQGRLVTKSELAHIVGRKKLSPSYFIKYPELGQYVKIHTQKSLETYVNTLYDWLKKNNIPYKPNDRSALKGSAVDALLLGEYSNLAIYLSERNTYVSKKIHNDNMELRLHRADEAGIKIICLTKEHFENLDNLKLLLDELKNDKEK